MFCAFLNICLNTLLPLRKAKITQQGIVCHIVNGKSLGRNSWECGNGFLMDRLGNDLPLFLVLNSCVIIFVLYIILDHVEVTFNFFITVSIDKGGNCCLIAEEF